MGNYSNLKRIVLRPQQPEIAAAILSQHAVSPVVAQILAARNFTPGKSMADFLNPTLKDSLPIQLKLKTWKLQQI